MTTVLFTRDGGTYTVEFAYSPVVVEMLKASVPSYARSWDKAAKQWTVAGDWAAPLAAALRGIGCTIIGLEADSSCKGWAQHLFRAVGQRRAPAVHRALTRVLHPDNPSTGCPTLQRELNDARSELERKPQ